MNDSKNTEDKTKTPNPEDFQVFIDKDVSDNTRGYANQNISLVDSSGNITRITLIF